MKMNFLNGFEITLSDAEKKTLASGKPVQKWVQIFRLGHWKHPRYGPLKFTEEIFNGFVKSFKDNVRRIKLAIDQEHAPEKGAAGWIKNVENRGEKGFWALVEWTGYGAKLVADKTFQYLSGDFDYEWKDEETGRKFKNVLFGAALTNRPFIKGMSPINLSEYVEEIKTIEHLRNALALAEDVLKIKEETKVAKTDEEIMKAKDEDLTDEEKARKAEMMKKKLADRAKAIGLAEDATEEEVKKKEDEKKAALAERAKAVGLEENATEEEIKKKEDEKKKEEEKKLAEEEEDKKKKEEAKKKEEEDQKKTALAERAKKVGLHENATPEEIEKAEKEKEAIDKKTLQDKSDAELLRKPDEELTDEEKARKKELLKKKEESKQVNLSDIQAAEKRLSELREDKDADSEYVKLLEESIDNKKKLREERMENGKERVTSMLKEHWKKGKLTINERDKFESMLCNDIASGESSFRLSEKDESGEKVESTKKLSVIIDEILTARPPIADLEEKALQESKIEGNLGPGKTKEEIEKEDERIGKGVAAKVTGATKTAAAKKAKEKEGIKPDVNT